MTLSGLGGKGDFAKVTSAKVTSAFESWRDATVVICVWPS
jgi:hypothetical protein